MYAERIIHMQLLNYGHYCVSMSSQSSLDIVLGYRASLVHPKDLDCTQGSLFGIKTGAVKTL